MAFTIDELAKRGEVLHSFLGLLEREVSQLKE